MAAVSTETIILYHLDPTSSAAVIAQALKVQTPIRIFADTHLSVMLLEGILTDNLEGNLSVLVTNENTSGLAMNVLAMLLVEFSLGEVVYRFEAMSIDDIPDCTPRLVRIPEPKTIAVAERRRSPRRQFQDATKVTLTSIGRDSATRISGALLNLSDDGLACRLLETEIDSLEPDESVSVSFALSSWEQPFALTGRIVSRTKAGSPGYVVAGVEFESGEQMEQRSLLRQELRKSSTAANWDTES